MHSEVPDHSRMPVLVAVDGSRNCLATVDLGVAEAARRRAGLRILHVWPGRYTGPVRSGSPIPALADGRRLLDLAARRAGHLDGTVRIDVDLAEGSASNTIVQRSAEAQLLVIGHRDEVLTRPSWGSTAAYLAHHSACPLLVRRGVASERGPVVVAVSTRRPAGATVACAFKEAEIRGVALVAVNVWSPPDGAISRLYTADRRAAEARLAATLTDVRSAYPTVPVEELVVYDLDIPYTLERAAHRGRLLVAGVGRSGRLAELLYGSLSRSLTRQTPCPVLLVPVAWRPEGTGTSMANSADRP